MLSLAIDLAIEGARCAKCNAEDSDDTPIFALNLMGNVGVNIIDAGWFFCQPCINAAIETAVYDGEATELANIK